MWTASADSRVRRALRAKYGAIEKNWVVCRCLYFVSRGGQIERHGYTEDVAAMVHGDDFSGVGVGFAAHGYFVSNCMRRAINSKLVDLHVGKKKEKKEKKESGFISLDGKTKRRPLYS